MNPEDQTNQKDKSWTRKGKRANRMVTYEIDKRIWNFTSQRAADERNIDLGEDLKN